MNAERVAIALGGKQTGRHWMAKCPVHDDRTPSLSLSDSEQGLLLVNCFAGCEARDIITALQSRGLWDAQPSQASHLQHNSRTTTSEGATSIWHKAHSAQGTTAETYLRKRGISLPVPSAIRFSPALTHRTGAKCPAMVALITNAVTNEPMAVHRTYLDRSGIKADIEPNKMMLGRTAGGVVRLSDTETDLLVGEGIETVLSAMQATGRPGWAALSTSGLKSLTLPYRIREITVLADGDAPGQRAARAAAQAWSSQGVQVRIAYAPERNDFNDLLNRHLDAGGRLAS